MANRGGTTSSQTKGTTARRSPQKWTVSGVSKETREAVARAAKKDGMPVGKWVDTTLRVTAETRLKGGFPSLALPPDLLDTLSELSERVKELSERRSLGGQALAHAQETASDLSNQISATYDAVIKRADTAIDDIRSWTDETLDDAAKLGTSVIEQIKSAAGGIERLQKLVTSREKAERESPQPKEKA